MSKHIDDRFRTHAIEVLSLRVAAVLLLYVLHATLARFLGAAEYGIFSFALAACGIVLAVVSLGWSSSIVLFVAKYFETQSWEFLIGSIRQSHKIIATTSIMSSVLLLAIYYSSLFKPETSNALLISAMILPLLGILNLRRMIFQGMSKVWASIVPEDIFLPIAVISILLIFRPDGLFYIINIYLLALIVSLLLSVYWMNRAVPIEVRDAEPSYKNREWMLASLPLMASGLGQVILNRTDVLMVGSMMNMHMAGIYSAASRISLIVSFALMVVNAAIAPLISSSYFRNQFDELRALYVKGVLWSAFGGLPLFCLIGVFPGLPLSLFGGGFVEGTQVLQVLVVGQMVMALTGPVGKVLIMVGHQRYYAYPVFIAAIANLAGDYVAINYWGVIGAAVITMVCQMSLATVHYYFVRQILRDLQKDNEAISIS